MKIVKFGSITTDAVGGLVFNGFDFESPDHDVEQGIEMFVYFDAAMCVVDFIKEKISAIAPPVAAQGGQLQESLVSLYRYKTLPRTVTPGGPIMGVITEVFESENDNTRIIIETSNGGASLRAEKLSAPVAAGSGHDVCRDSERFYRQNCLAAIERAEKAEADLKQVNEWRAAALASNQQMQELMAAKLATTEARVKELEADRSAMQAECKHLPI